MKKCRMCNSECQDDSIFCEECGASLGEEELTQDSNIEDTAIEPVVEKNDKKRRIIRNSAIVAAIVFVVGLLTNWFGMVSPIQGLIKAVGRTVKAESMTIKVEMKRTYENGGEVREYREETTTRLIIDKDKEEVTYLTEGEDYTTLYIDGEVFYYSDSYAYSFDDEFEEEFFDVYNDSVGSKKGIKWKKLIKKAELEDYLDYDEMDDFIKTFYKKLLCNKKWLKDTAGYSRSGNEYSFELDIEEFGEDIIDICDDSDALSRTAKRGVEDYIEMLIEDAEEVDGEIEIKATVKGGKLVKLKIIVETDSSKTEYTLKFSNINKTKISNKTIKEIQNTTEKMIEENTCEECGTELWWYDENEHGDCKRCREHGYLHEYRGNYYCYDCWYDYEYDW